MHTGIEIFLIRAFKTSQNCQIVNVSRKINCRKVLFELSKRNEKNVDLRGRRLTCVKMAKKISVTLFDFFLKISWKSRKSNDDLHLVRVLEAA